MRDILRYHKPNPDKYPEKCAHHILFTFYSFCNENNSKFEGSYFPKLQQSSGLDVVNLNIQKLKSYSELVNNALLNLQTNVRSKCWKWRN